MEAVHHLPLHDLPCLLVDKQLQHVQKAATGRAMCPIMRMAQPCEAQPSGGVHSLPMLVMVVVMLAVAQCHVSDALPQRLG
jgi:hypothetical protein